MVRFGSLRPASSIPFRMLISSGIYFDGIFVNNLKIEDKMVYSFLVLLPTEITSAALLLSHFLSTLLYLFVQLSFLCQIFIICVVISAILLHHPYFSLRLLNMLQQFHPGLKKIKRKKKNIWISKLFILELNWNHYYFNLNWISNHFSIKIPLYFSWVHF